MKTVTVTLTQAEAKALLALIREGAEGILTDDAAISGYLGGKRGADAARRAMDKYEVAYAAASSQFVTVPVKPTAAMSTAGWNALYDDDTPEDIWTDMLRAHLGS